MICNVIVVVIQMVCFWDCLVNIVCVEKLVCQVVVRGVQIILIQELFEIFYFCQKLNLDYLQLVIMVEENVVIVYFQVFVWELQVVLLISFFECVGCVCFNSIVVIDVDGGNFGVYCKSYILDGLGYYEKYYFNLGDIGFKVWQICYVWIGVGICWDQWFFELVCSMVLFGVEFLFYLIVIGSELYDVSISLCDYWQCVQ